MVATLTLQGLASVWARAGLEAPVRFDEVTGSTNTAASELARHGAPEWTVVAAGHQTSGRGREGRMWEDRPGASLLFSIVLRPGLPPLVAGAIPLLAGLALAEAAADVAGAATGCKWPNDVLAAGRKCAGILIETEVAGATIGHLVLGIGVNLFDPPRGMPEAGAVAADAEPLLDAFLDVFLDGYRPDEPGFVADVADRYRPWCVTLGRQVRATTTDGLTVEGEAVDLDERGGLRIATRDGPTTVSFGEIEHLR